MPQLDINTFSYQYIGIISLLIIVYIILSYIVLPILLRLMLVRNHFLLSQQKMADLLQISNFSYQQVIITHRPLYTNFLVKTIISNTIQKVRTFVSLLNINLSNTFSLTTPSLIVSCSSFVTDTALSYLILLLSTDIEENE